MNLTKSESRSRSRSRSDSTERKNELNTRIWVGGLGDGISERILKEVFEPFGEVLDVKIRSTPHDLFAFLDFKTHDQAVKAIGKMDQCFVNQKRVKVSWAQFRPANDSGKTSSGKESSGKDSSSKESSSKNKNRDENNRIWVGRISKAVEESDLRDEFERFGDILEIKIRANNKDTFAFIEFESQTAAARAIQSMDKQMIKGHEVKVDWAAYKNRNGNNNGSGKVDSFSNNGRKSRRSRSRSNRRFSNSRSARRSFSPSSSRSRSPRKSNNGKDFGITITNLPPEIAWQDLKDIGQKYGGPESVKFARTWTEGKLCMGVICFRQKPAMQFCYDNLYRHRINGYRLKVADGVPQSFLF